MRERWAVVDVDMKQGEPLDAVDSLDTTMVCATIWWGPAAIGRLVFTAEQLPVSYGFLWKRFAELVAPVLAARAAPSGYAVPGSDGGPSGRPPDELRNIATTVAGLDQQLLGTHSSAALPEVDVVVCTRGRGSDLSAVLEGLARQTSHARAVIVVDNNDQAHAAIRRQVGDVRNGVYVHEPNRGLSIARNAGIRAGSSPIVAFTDDDATAHPAWLQRLLAPFADQEVESVTGLVLPLDLDGRAAAHFEMQTGGLGGGFGPVRFDDRFVVDALPFGLPTWRVGSGANMAVRRSAFARVGGFDERLGAGASGCSEDSELWYRLLADGGVCVSEPLAVMWHRHRSTMRDLRRQLYAYQRGHVAALVAQQDRHHHLGNRRRALRQLPRHHLRQAAWMLRRPSTAATFASEVSGYLAGLRFYADRSWRSQTSLPDVGE